MTPPPTPSTPAPAAAERDDAPPAPGMPGAPTGKWARSPVRRALLLVGATGFAAFWIWALFFASKEAVNQIGDEEWTQRAEAICVEYDVQIRALDELADPDLEVRADLVVTSTDLFADMLDDITAVEPADEKGQAIVPDWIADYRTLLEDRYRYAERLRGGENVPFTETAVNGVPITERLETFAGDNDMPTCAPPRGSVV